MDLTWEEPPLSRQADWRRDTYFREVAELLKSKPGEWAIISTDDMPDQYKRNLVTGINSGKRVTFLPRGSFQATSRKVGDVVTIYARYVGSPETE